MTDVASSGYSRDLIIVDLDGTLCTKVEDGDYTKAQPIQKNIDKVNKLSLDNHIVIWTARGTTTGDDWSEVTAYQLFKWKVQHHAFQMGKPYYDRWIDDKSENWDEDYAHSTTQ